MSHRTLVFPVGHYAGQRPARHRIRLGRGSEELTTDEFEVWLRAHGADGSDGFDRSGWPAETVHGLLARGVLATTPATGVHATRFVKQHRMGSLLCGLADGDQPPGRYAVGVPGLPAVAWLESGAYTLWTWAPAAPSLWHLCLAMAEGDSRFGGAVEREGAVSSVLADLRVLLGYGCAYLDRCTPVSGRAVGH